MTDGTEKNPRWRSLWSTGGRLVGSALLGVMAWFLSLGLVLSLSSVANGESGNLGIWMLTLVAPPLLGSFVFCLVHRTPIKWQHGLWFGLCLGVMVLMSSLIGTRSISPSYSHLRLALGVAVYVVSGGLGGQLAQAMQLTLCGRDGRRVCRLKMWHIGVSVAGALVVAVVVVAQFIDLSE